MKRSLLVWTVSGLIIGLGIGLADALVLVLTARAMFFYTGELLHTAAWTVGMVTGVAVIILSVGGIVIDQSCRLLKHTRLWDRHRALSFTLAAVFFVPIFVVFWQLTKGPQASQMPGRLFVVAGAAVILAIVLGTAVVRIPHWSKLSIGRRRIVAIVALLIVGLLYFMDLVVLVRLYPVFHITLTVAICIIGGVGLRLWIRPFQSVILIVALCLLAAGAIVFGSWSMVMVRNSQNPRFVISERAPSASDLLTLSRLLVPPPPEKLLDKGVPEIEITSAVPKSGPAITHAKADLILLTVDAMRYDRLAALGATREVVPNMDKLAKNAIVFARAYSPIPHTSYAISSFLTGKYTSPLFDVPGAPRVHETWPEIMSRFRYKTAAFFTRAIFFIDRARFEPYFRSSYGFSFRKVDYLMPASDRAQQLIDYLEEMRNDPNPVFAWAHFFDPHEPYDAKCTHFGSTPMDRYDCELWKVDQALGKIVTYLDEAYPESIIIIASDHGEEFDDHGGRYHGTTLYDEQIRVPLIIRVPGVPPRIVTEPVSLVDLLGTSLTILDIPIPARVRSRDLTGLMTGRQDEFDAFSEVHDKSMVTTKAHKLICDSASGLCQLYDLAADPKEKRSVAGLKPEVFANMKARLRAWEKSHARFELRPIATQMGASKWPLAVQKALGGDKNAIPGLLTVIQEHPASLVRCKAAELLYDMWSGFKLQGIPSPQSETSSNVSAWLILLQFRAGAADAIEALALISKRLEPLSNVWRTVALTRLGAKDKRAYKDVVQIALEEGSPIEDRQRAIRLIGKAGRRKVVPRLLEHINNYQLTLEIAAALGLMGDPRAVNPLIKRLKRERFKERKSAIIEALSAIGDKRAFKPIAGELLLDEPPKGTVGALVLLGHAPPHGRPLSLPGKETKAMLYGTPLPDPFIPRIKSIHRIVVLTKAKSEGGSVVIRCNGKESGRVPLVSGEQEATIDTNSCIGQDKAFPQIHLQIEPKGLEANITAAALIGRNISY